MNNDELLKRIEINPDVLRGKPVIKGTWLAVSYILELLVGGASFEEILEEYNTLTKEEILACLTFASQSIECNMFLPLKASA